MTETPWTESTTGATADSDDEWREVDAEAKIVLESIGDGFIGRYMGMDPPNANGIVQAHFTNVTHLDGDYIADKAFINATRDHQNKLRSVPVKSLTRNVWSDNLDTGHESGTPMRVMSVQYK